MNSKYLLSITICIGINLIFPNAFYTHSSEIKVVYFSENLESVYVDWFVDSPITSKTFPVGLFSTDNPINFTITSSWGIKINGTRNRDDEPHLIWLSLPANSSEGQGEVNVRLNNQLNETHTISWKRREFSSSPVEIQLSHHWFSYWTGSTLLKARLSENGTINIQHEISQLSHEEYRKYLPYNESFSFLNELSSYEWFLLMDYLLKNDSLNWQSWTYPPVNTQHPIMTMCDGGGFETSVKIIWNDTTDVRYNEMVDNDRCTGKRIYIPSVTAYFNDILFNLINKKISSYFQSRTVLSPSVITTDTTQISSYIQSRTVTSSSVITTDTTLFIFLVSSLAALLIGMTLAYLYEKIQKIDL